MDKQARGAAEVVAGEIGRLEWAGFVGDGDNLRQTPVGGQVDLFHPRAVVGEVVRRVNVTAGMGAED